uniref:Uncharacterized protein n=1 Tax=Macaca nemestrina TaxID=9545 RepID=A0A2K6BR98_MACNE
MIVLILSRIGPNKLSLSAQQAPAQAQTSDPVPILFPPGRWAPRVGTWGSPDEGRRPRKPIPGTGNKDSGTRRRRQDATEQDPRPGNDVASPETAGLPSPAGIGAQERAPRHRRAPPARMPVAPAPSADREPLQGRGGGLSTAPGAFTTGWKLNTWMEVERLFVEKFHQSFSLDN